MPERRLQALQKRLHSVAQSPKSSARDIAQVTGTIVSMGLALGPVARLWTRGLYRFIMQASTWGGGRKELNEGAMREIVFWRNNFETCHGQPIWWVNTKPDISTYSDASDSGWGGYSVELGGNIAKGQWSAEEELKSSTWRELRATHLVLKSFLPNIQVARTIVLSNEFPLVANTKGRGKMRCLTISEVSDHLRNRNLLRHPLQHWMNPLAYETSTKTKLTISLWSTH